MSEDHSITNLLHNLRDGHSVTHAQQLIWDRFFHRLRGLAERKIDARTRRSVDGEDIAIQAFHDFFAQVGKSDALQNLTDRTSLWQLLAKITSRKAINEFRRANAQKRGRGLVRGESAFVYGDDDGSRGIEQIERELTPEFADEMFLGFESVLSELKSHGTKFYDVAILRLKGYSTKEIAEQLGYQNAKTPERIIKQIRILWKSFHGGLARASIVDAMKLLFETQINEEPTIVGRQRKGDPKPYCSSISDLHGQAIRRIIVAGNEQKSISRNHATIQIKDETTVEITNSSQKSQILVNEETLLSPGDVWSTDGSCNIQIGDAMLHIDLT